MTVLRARWLVPDASTVIEGGALVVEGGRVVEVAARPSDVAALGRGGKVRDLGDVVLAPALINAHAHLELSALAGRVSADGGFGAWVGRLMAERATTPAGELASAAREAAIGLAASGHAWVGDVDSLGLVVAPSCLGGVELGVVHLREVLDAQDPTRTAQALGAVAEPLVLEPHRLEGLSPHAPFTVSPVLMAALGRIAAERALPVAIHWSETEAELDWMLTGEGPLAALLGPSPCRSGLDVIDEAGLLGPRTLLIHGNHPARGEPARLAAAGATLVHCPGTQRFFGRGPAPLAAYLAAGVALALGTDSAASNSCLDLRQEMSWLRQDHPELSPDVVLRMATEGGARALGVGAGRLRPGERADWVAFLAAARRAEDVLDELTTTVPDVLARSFGGPVPF